VAFVAEFTAQGCRTMAIATRSEPGTPACGNLKDPRSRNRTSSLGALRARMASQMRTTYRRNVSGSAADGPLPRSSRPPRQAPSLVPSIRRVLRSGATSAGAAIRSMRPELTYTTALICATRPRGSRPSGSVRHLLADLHERTHSPGPASSGKPKPIAGGASCTLRSRASSFRRPDRIHCARSPRSSAI